MISDVDREAMQRAIDLARVEGDGEQIDALHRNAGFERAGQFAAACCQDRALQLRPWQPAPCCAEICCDIEGHFARGDDGVLGRYVAAQIAQRLIDCGRSVFEPDPIGALHRVERDLKKSAARSKCRT